MNVTGTRTEVIISPYGVAHAPKRSAISGGYIRRMDWRLTACGLLAERGWTQRRAYGYVACKNCVKMLERA